LASCIQQGGGFSREYKKRYVPLPCSLPCSTLT
jgi:hypothetical protein